MFRTFNNAEGTGDTQTLRNDFLSWKLVQLSTYLFHLAVIASSFGFPWNRGAEANLLTFYGHNNIISFSQPCHKFSIIISTSAFPHGRRIRSLKTCSFLSVQYSFRKIMTIGVQHFLTWTNNNEGVRNLFMQDFRAKWQDWAYPWCIVSHNNGTSVHMSL